MKKTKLHIIVLIFLIVLIAGYSFIVSSVKDENVSARYDMFWENPESYDVWLAGSSHVYYAFLPIELWKDYGIKSYNLGVPGAHLPQIYWTLKSALKESKPKVVVLDTYHLDKNTYKIELKEYQNVWVESIPFSLTKLKAINEVFQKPSERLYYLLYLYKLELFLSPSNSFVNSDASDFVLGSSKKLNHERIPRNMIVDKDKTLENETTGTKYLCKIIEELQSQNIQVVLTALPYYETEGAQIGLNSVEKIAKKYNIPLIDERYNGVFDLDVDFADLNHLNPIGAKKSTIQIGEFLSTHYNLDCRDNEEDVKTWNQYIENEDECIEKSIKNEDDLLRYILYLQNSDYVGYVYTKSENKNIEKLIHSMDCIKAVNKQYASKYAEINNRFDYCIIVRNATTNKVVDVAAFKDMKRNFGK